MYQHMNITNDRLKVDTQPTDGLRDPLEQFKRTV